MKKIGIVILSVILSGCEGNKEVTGLERYSFTSMGTIIRIGINSREGKVIVQKIKKEFSKIQNLMGTRKVDGDVYRLNYLKGEFIKISRETIEVLKKSEEMCRKTGGYFNPGIYRIFRKFETLNNKRGFPESLALKKNCQRGANFLKLRGIRLDCTETL